MLHNILHERGIPPEEIITIRKEYYIVSNTEIKGNKSNFHRKGRTGELFGFIEKITPFPFGNVEPIDKNTFISLVENLEKKQLKL